MPTTSPTNVPAAGHATAENGTDARIADKLASSGISITRDFLAPQDVRTLAGECRSAWLGGDFQPARVGRGNARELRSELRGDSICWLREPHASAAQRDLFARMERLRVEINRRTYIGLFDLECHFAVYPPGAVYARHLDRFRDASHRLVSWALYLNEAWAEDEGGCLRIYSGGNAAGDDLDVPPVGGDHLDVSPVGGDHLNVPPIGGTLVTFLSAEFEHEVLRATRERMSVTGWFCSSRR